MKLQEAQGLFLAGKRVFLAKFVGEEVTQGNRDDGSAYAMHTVHVYTDKDVLHINVRHPKNLNREELIPKLMLKEFDPVIVHLQQISGTEYGARITGTVQPVVA